MNSKMKKQLLVILGALLFTWYPLSSQVRQEKILTADWKFAKGHQEGAHLNNFDDSEWESVLVPHDWAIKGPFVVDGNGNTGKLPWKGEGWYRTWLPVTPDLAGKTVYLIFDGVMAFPEVFVNGKLAGRWDYGYNSFYLDITEFLQENGHNLLTVHVDTRNHDSRWYPGAGIFRKVSLLEVNPVHVSMWGSYVTTPIIKKEYSDVRIAHHITNNSQKNIQSVVIENQVYNPDGKLVASGSSNINLKPGDSNRTEITFTLKRPQKWDIDNPVLYTVKATIKNGNKILDEYITPFGIREVRFTADEGFYLNDRRVQLKGVNLHHDHGPLGARFNYRAMERQLEIMKDMGCNAVRNSHNTASPEFLELCDKMGLLVLNEVFDKYDAKADITDTTIFETFAERNIRNFILRDRNHPSVFLWSVGNEIMDVMENEDNGFYRLNIMVSYVRLFDPSRPVTLVSSKESTAALRHFDYYDVHCWNYGRRYSLARQIEPNKSVIISESASTLSTRGFYELPLPENKTDFTNSLQVSSYDLNAPMWAEIADDDFMWQEEENYIAGEFVWTGFDYLGEPTPYDNAGVKKLGMTDKEASRSSYFGIVDLCGIPKDRYFLYKSYWKPDETTIHILPHWNWEGMEGMEVPVFVYTNGDSAELFLNGVSHGTRRKVPNSPVSVERYRLMWKDIEYKPGELRTVAYKDGVILGEKVIHTAGSPARLVLTPDRTQLKSGERDLSYILIEAYDENGRICPLANNEVTISVEGEGIIAGVGNGNPQSFDPFVSSKVKLFYGKAMLIVEAGDKTGNIRIKVSSVDLTEGKTQLFVSSE
jgi:beta-galactosidase